LGYLKLPRVLGIVGLFLTSSLLLALFPAVDLRVSGSFLVGRGFAAPSWATLLHESVGYFIGSALSLVVGIYAYNRVARRNVLGVDLKVVAYLFLVLVLGSGIVVNVVLKNGFGRARPRDVVQFGGSKQFTAAFAVAGGCATNCSFSSGDSSGAFFSLGLALALSRRRAPILVAAVYGCLVSFSRIATGAHFLSDTVVSFFVMWIAADALYHFMLLPRLLAERQTLPVALPQVLSQPEVRSLDAIPSYARASLQETAHDTG
jgi:lipid A 4'-phosphatase